MSESDGRKKTLSSRLAGYAVLLFYAATVAILFGYLRETDFGKLFSLRPDPFFLSGALAATVLSRFAFSAAYLKVLHAFSKTALPWPAANLCYARAWMVRYVPGKVAVLVARICHFDRLGARHGEVTASSLVDALLAVFVGGVLGATLLGFSELGPLLRPELKMLVACIALATPVLLFKPTIDFAIRLAVKITKRDHFSTPPDVGLKTLIWPLPNFILAQAIVGLMNWLLLRSLDSTLALSTLPLVAGLYCLAGAVGSVAFFTPSGLGVKELVLLPFLLRITSNEVTLTMLALARFMELIADFVYLAVSVAWARWGGPKSATGG